jgi:uncharacterized membrane protein
MPYRWTDEHDNTQSLELWPHRSLPPQGFALFFGITACMFAVPLSTVLGTAVLWYILPFIVGTVAFMWLMLKRNYRDGELCEVLTIAQDTVALIRHNPRRPDQSWQANPYWVRVELHETGGPVANYVTLSGSGREVEIGAFLSPEERETLYHDLQDRLRALDINTPR